MQTMQAAVQQGWSILECLCSTVEVSPCSSGTTMGATNIMSAPEGRLRGMIGRSCTTQATSPPSAFAISSTMEQLRHQAYSAARGRRCLTAKAYFSGLRGRAQAALAVVCRGMRYSSMATCYRQAETILRSIIIQGQVEGMSGQDSSKTITRGTGGEGTLAPQVAIRLVLLARLAPATEPYGSGAKQHTKGAD